MHRLGTYIPQDRLRALIQGESLPSHTVGSAIFADISGFTILTEKLTQTLGARQGVEALSQQLNAVYGALIDQVERYGGSVISFAGDSIIGWFEEAVSASSASWRAVTCISDQLQAVRYLQFDRDYHVLERRGTGFSCGHIARRCHSDHLRHRVQDRI